MEASPASPHDLAQRAFADLKEAILQCLRARPDGLRNTEVADALGLRTEFDGKQKNFLTWTLLKLLVAEGRARAASAGGATRYQAVEEP